jgi:CelD/BcsL family acetyltransferase involved in cellulose biosynthesis
MEIEFVHTAEGFEDLRAEWNNLLETAVTNTPFQRHEYLSVWWSTRGGGEWDSGELWIATGRDEAGDLQAIAPLFQTSDRERGGSLRLIGSIEISDYLDVVAGREHLQEFVEALFTKLDREGPEGWQSFDLSNLPEGSPTIEVMEEAAGALGWEVDRQRLQPCPIVYLPDSWDGYLDQLDSKQGRELRRKMRKAQGYPASVDWYLVKERSDLEASVDTFLSLMENDSAKAEFLTAEMRSHFHRMCAAAFDSGWLQIAFLTVSNEPIFGYVNFDYGNRLWIYNSGFDPDHFDLSPGWVLMGYLIQWAIDEGREAVDFLRGDESYKYRLGGQDRFIASLSIRREQ